MYRQGDVLLVPVTAIPDGTEKVARDNGRVILAYGEVTGHAHALTEVDALLAEVVGERFLSVPSGGELRHEEHDTITVAPGDYRVVIQREYQPVVET